MKRPHNQLYFGFNCGSTKLDQKGFLGALSASYGLPDKRNWRNGSKLGQIPAANKMFGETLTVLARDVPPIDDKYWDN